MRPQDHNPLTHIDLNFLQERPSDCTNPVEGLPVEKLTHINFAFAFIDAEYGIKLPQPTDIDLLTNLVNLRSRNPELKIILCIGGSAMNDPYSSYKTRLSNMVKTKLSRANFINSTFTFLDEYKLDGIEIDWEYPGDPETGGNSWDKAGLVSLSAEFKSAAKAASRTTLLAVALPATLDQWGNFEAGELEPYVDYFSVMTYDYTGSWETYTGYHALWKDPAAKSNSYNDIVATIRHYTVREKVPIEKLNIGLAAYGRSWTLKQPLPTVATNSSLYKAVGPGQVGHCDSEHGVLVWRDIIDIMQKNADAWLYQDDAMAKSAFMVFGDQFVSFDLPESMYYKQKAAIELGIGGFSLWNSLLDDENWTLTKQLGAMEDPGPFSVPGIIGKPAQLEKIPNNSTSTTSDGT